MPQNLVTLNLTDAQLAAVDAALAELERQLAGLIVLTAAQKKSLRRMGPMSEAFCRQTLRVLDHNPQIVPPNLPLADANADLRTLDALRPRLVRLSRLSERAADTDTALGSDILSVARFAEAERAERGTRGAAAGTGGAVCGAAEAGG